MLQFLNSGKLKVTHRHTPWSHWRCAGLEGSWHNIAHCVNTSPPYILCKNCDWNTLHNCLFYILKDTGEKKKRIKSFQSHIDSGEVLLLFISLASHSHSCSGKFLVNVQNMEYSLWFWLKKSKWLSRERTRGILFPLRDLLVIKQHGVYLGEYFTSNTLLLKTRAPQASFFWKVGVNEYSQSIVSVGFSWAHLSTPQSH